jgi:hypothetical protein
MFSSSPVSTGVPCSLSLKHICKYIALDEKLHILFVSYMFMHTQILKDSEQGTPVDTGEEENIGMLDTNLTI